MSQKIEAQLSLGTWVYLAGLVGLTGGFTIGAISATWALIHGNLIEALVTLLTSPICGLLGLCLYAALGFPVYKYLSSKYPGVREITAVFSGVNDSEPQS
ncbi:hypothetical protein ACOAPY_06635 [Pseudomonas sp. P3C3]